jgi:CubicO group peptidase (beta-lactamase class C family)
MDVQGFADGRFGSVRQYFAEILAAQPGTGAAFAAWCDDSLVVDLWGGYADLGRGRRWGADSLVQPYSVSKPFAAVCALRLVQAGRLDLDAPVQRYWLPRPGDGASRAVASGRGGDARNDLPEHADLGLFWMRTAGHRARPGQAAGPRRARSAVPRQVRERPAAAA